MPELLRFLICLIGQLKIALGKGGFNICTRLFLLDISSNCCLIAQCSDLLPLGIKRFLFWVMLHSFGAEILEADLYCNVLSPVYTVVKWPKELAAGRDRNGKIAVTRR